MTVRVGVDVGGTFTDIVVFDEQKGVLENFKLPSTSLNPEEAVSRGTAHLLQAMQVDPEDVLFFIHGTTVATNAVLEGKGARVALLVTRGFRDVLEVMRQDRPRLYDYFVARPDPLVERRLRLEVDERMLYSGEVDTPLDEDQVRALLAGLREEEIRDFAVCFLHSYANPAHEARVGELIEAEIPDARTSLSSEILPEIKEFERMSTTVVNAAVKPLIARYLSRLEKALHQLGVGSDLHLMQSNGGIMTSETARHHCVHTVLSGPAAGALSGLILSSQAGVHNMISIDVGGTSADVAVAFEGRLNFAEENEIGGHIIKAPSIEIHTVGAGGGSIAWLDDGGALQVGPRSAGAVPGPACYGRGGEEPTVTDAHLVLGRLAEGSFLGGDMSIDAERAARAIRERVAEPLGLSLLEAADGIIQIANSVMVKAMRRLSVEKGYDPRDFTLVAFGGAGPLHACEMARELQVRRVLIPPVPGVSSALGLLTADYRHDYVRTILAATQEVSLEVFQSRFEEMVDQARRQMEGEHVDLDRLTYSPLAEVRYLGQGFSLPVRFTLEDLAGWRDLGPLVERFHGTHQEMYGYSDAREPTEIVNLRLAAVGELSRPAFPRSGVQGEDPGQARTGTRQAYLAGSSAVTSVFERKKLQTGNRLAGPAIVEQSDTTTLVLSGWSAEVDAYGNLIMTPETP